MTSVCQNPVFVVINDDFLNAMDWQVAIDTTSVKAVGRFNKFERQEVNDLFENTTQMINTSSLAQVCHTDSITVDLVIQEFVAQLAENAKKGSSIRLNFKCGWILIKQGIIQWQHSRDLLMKYGVTTNDNGEMVSIPTSVQDSNQVSVETPSVARFSRATRSIDPNHFHMSNPNPQVIKAKFQGARDANSSTRSDKAEFDMLNLKFGKKVNFSNKLTTNDVLEDHLAQIKRHK